MTRSKIYWIGDKLEITYHAEELERILELIIEVPLFVLYTKAAISLNCSSRKKQKWVIKRGKRFGISLPLEEGENHFSFSVKTTFVPSENNGSLDYRKLGILCRQCRIVLPSGEYKTLWPDK